MAENQHSRDSGILWNHLTVLHHSRLPQPKQKTSMSDSIPGVPHIKTLKISEFSNLILFIVNKEGVRECLKLFHDFNVKRYKNRKPENGHFGHRLFVSKQKFVFHSMIKKFEPPQSNHLIKILKQFLVC